MARMVVVNVRRRSVRMLRGLEICIVVVYDGRWGCMAEELEMFSLVGEEEVESWREKKVGGGSGERG